MPWKRGGSGQNVITKTYLKSYAFWWILGFFGGAVSPPPRSLWDIYVCVCVGGGGGYGWVLKYSNFNTLNVTIFGISFQYLTILSNQLLYNDIC